jgi:YVTN family beta-propeller protein
MKMNKLRAPKRPFAVVLAAALAVSALLAGRGVASTVRQTQAAQSSFTIIADRPLPGNTSRFDYLSLDPGSDAHRLYIAHLGAGTLVVFDTQAGSVVSEIGGVPGAHGVLAVPELGRVYASATDVNQVAVIDASSLGVIASVPAGQYPDGIAFDPDVGKLYVSDETGGTDTVIDTGANQVVSTIDLGGEVGNSVFDPNAHQILAAVQTRNQVVTIDPATDTVSGRYDTPGCDHPHGLALDPDHRLAFIGCENNARMAVFDLTAHNVTGLHEVGSGPDVLVFDSGWNRLYVAAESGPLTAFDESGSDVREVGRGDVGPNAHSIAVNPQTHHIFTPVANLGGAPVLRELAIGAPGE